MQTNNRRFAGMAGRHLNHHFGLEGVRRFDVDVIFATVMINLLSLIMPLAMMQIFNRVLPYKSTGTLTGIFWILIAYIVVDACLKIARARLYIANSISAEQGYASAVFDRLFHARLSDLRKIGRDSLSERLFQLRDFGRIHANLALTSRIDMAFSALFIGVIFLLAPLLAAVTLIAVFAVAVWSIRMRSRFKSASQMQVRNGESRNSFLSELFRLTPELKLLGIEQVLLRRYEMLQANSSGASETLHRINASAASLAALVGQLSTGVVSVIGAYLVIERQIGLADLAATILLAGRAIQPVIRALLIDMDEKALGDAVERTSAITALNYQEDQVDDGGAAPARVDFKQVTLREPWSCAKLLDRVDLTIPAGSLVALQGRSDAPAGRVLRMISGELLPDAGTLSLSSEDGGVVGPTVFLGPDPDVFDAEILENITAFRGRSTEPETLRLGRILGLDRDVQVIPGGYNHVLRTDARGHGSTGFGKKLRLARNLAIPSGLLLLDRPFDGLDPRAQAGLKACLEDLRGKRTILISNVPTSVGLSPDITLAVRPDLPLLIRDGRSGVDTGIPANRPQAPNGTQATA